MTGLGIGSPPSDASENPLAPNPVSSSPAGRELVARTEVFVRRLFEGNDASHDFSHVDRVRRLAVKLGESLISRSVYANLLTVELAALLHDVGDAKYADKHAAQLAELLPGADRDKGVPQQFLQRVGCPPDLANEVQAIVERVGFRKEIGTSSHADTYKSNELDCVRDADKLDAIGAIGIARCFAFGGATGAKLHDPTPTPSQNISQEEYSNRPKGAGACIAHFYEKLFRLSSMIKTEEGKKIAKERHEYMKGFVEQFEKEWKGQA